MGVYVGAGAATAEYALEASYGNGDTLDTALDLVEESMRENTEPLRSGVFMGSRAHKTYHLGSKGASGDIKFIANPDNLPKILYAALGTEAEEGQVDETTAYDHDFTPEAVGGDLPSLNVGIDKHGSEYGYPGLVINTITFEFTKGDYLYVTLGTLAQKELDDQSGLQGVSLSTKLPYIGDYASLEIGGVAKTYGISGSIVINNFLDEEGSYRLTGDRFRSEPRPQTFMVTANLEIEWESGSDALRDAIRDNTDTQVTIVVTHETAIEAGYYYTLTIDIPTAKIIGELPVLSTRDRIPFPLTIEGVYNVTNLVKVTHRDALNAKWSA